jgi:hypothetical protein
MQEPSHIRKALVLGGLIFSFVGLCWLLSLPYKPDGFLPRIGLLSAALSTLGGFIFCWAATFAYFAPKLSSSPRTCYLAGLVFLIPLAYFWIFDFPHFWSILGLSLGSFSLTGYACRHLAYPQLTDEEFSALPPPPSLFQK